MPATRLRIQRRRRLPPVVSLPVLALARIQKIRVSCPIGGREVAWKMKTTRTMGITGEAAGIDHMLPLAMTTTMISSGDIIVGRAGFGVLGSEGWAFVQISN